MPVVGNPPIEGTFATIDQTWIMGLAGGQNQVVANDIGAAASGTQADATPLQPGFAMYNIDTATANNASVALPVATPPYSFVVINNSPFAVTVWPAHGTTDKINGVASLSMPTNSSSWFVCGADGSWLTTAQGGGGGGGGSMALVANTTPTSGFASGNLIATAGGVVTDSGIPISGLSGAIPLMLNVKEYGAQGDSVTDDTKAIQAAVNDAVTKQATLWFPTPTGGTDYRGSFYVINGAIDIPRYTPPGLSIQAYSSGWALIGSGGMIGILQKADATPIFRMRALAAGDQFVNFRIENFQGFWQNSQAYPTTAAPSANFDSSVILFDAQGCAFTATSSGTTLTASAFTSGSGMLLPGSVLEGGGLPYYNVIIVSQTSGTPGGPGVYVTNVATTLSGAAITGGVTFYDSIGFFFFQIKNITNSNGCRCVAMSQGFQSGGYTGNLMQGQIAVWGCLFERLAGQYGSSGAVLQLMNNGFGGQPNILVNHIYLNQGNSTGKNYQHEEAIFGNGMDTVTFNNVELNYTDGMVAYFLGGRRITFNTVRVEAPSGTDNLSPQSSSNCCFTMLGSQLDINGLEIQHGIWNFTSQNRAIINHAYATVELNGYDFLPNNTFEGGYLPLVFDGGGNGFTIIRKISDMNFPNLRLFNSPYTTSIACTSQRTMPFYLNSLSATATVPNVSAATVIDEIIEQECWIFALELYVDAPLTAGLITVQIIKNGTLLDSGNLQALVGPTTTANATTAGGSYNINLTTLPTWVQIGMYVSDITRYGTNGPIPPGAQITAVSYGTPGQITISKNVPNYNGAWTSNSTGTTTLAVSNITSGQALLGQTLTGTGIPAGTWIVGTAPIQKASFTASASNSSTLTVSGTVTGTIAIYDTLTGTGVPPNTIIQSQVSGTTGGAGTYLTSLQTSASGTCTTSTPTSEGNAGNYITSAATTLTNIATTGTMEVLSGDTIAFSGRTVTAAPQAGRSLAYTQFKNSVNANGAYRCVVGDALHVQFVTSGMAGAAAAKANIILAMVGGES
jgi:hypothetical protein